MTCLHLTFRWGLLVLLGVATRNAQAQRTDETEPPKTFRMQLTDKYLQTDVDFEHELQETGTPTTSIARQRAVVQPVVGLGLAGSVYHPYLLQYQLNTELGLDWEDTRVSPGNEGSSSRFLQRYHGSLDFLQHKPYATSVFADKDLTYRDYDFFSRVRVDTERYGGRTGYTEGPLPFSVSAQHYEEFIEDPTRPTWLSEDTLNFNMQNQRRSGLARTQMSYNLDQFSRQDDGYGTQRGLNQNVNVFDNEMFGHGDWINLNSLLNCNSITETVQPTSKVMVQENLRLEHTSKLRSFYEYGFDAAAVGDSDSRTHQGRVGLSYQFHEYLSSTFDLHGLTSSSASPGSWAAMNRFGISLDEQYSRPLGTWGSLTLGYAGRLDREERDTSGQTINILDETHTLSDGAVTFLNQPMAYVASIRVTDSTHTITYVEGLDYRISYRGLVTQIERIPGGRIPNGGVVLVEYMAVLQPSAAYASWDNTLNFRVDLWKGLLGIYGRWSMVDYAGGGQMLLRWLDDKTIGVDSTWRWLRAGAEYEIADSNLAPYDRVRLFQSAQFQPGEGTTLGLDLDQNWTHFRDTGLRQDTFGLIARYQQRWTETLAWNVEGGVRIDRGLTFDRNMAVARMGLDWTVGKLTVKVGYEYGNETQPASLTERHYFYMRVRRTF